MSRQRSRPFDAMDFIASHPVFRFDEFREAHGRSGASSKATDALLSSCVAAGRIMRIRRGLYGQASQQPDPLLLASHVTSDSVLAYDAALAFHGLSELNNSACFLTEQRTSTFHFDEVIYRPVPVPAALSRKRNWGGEILTVERDGQPLKVTSPERTLVDALERLDLTDGPRALWDAFCRAEPDLGTMIDYAKQLDNRVLIGRLAVFLQMSGRTNRVLDTLDSHAPRSPCYFNPNDRTKGDMFPRWSMVVPRRLLRYIKYGQSSDAD